MTIKRTPLVAALVLALAIGAATASAGRVTTAGPKMGEKNVVQTAIAAGDFKTLASLLQKAGLAGTLEGNGPYTVFAPTNAAFAKLKKTAPKTYAAVASDKALLKKVLTYHVLAKKVPSPAAIAAAKQNASVKTVEGEKIKLSLKGGKLFLNGNSQVIVADIAASNGVIHAINTVLVPPSAG